MTVLRFPYQAEKVETYKSNSAKEGLTCDSTRINGENPRWMRRQEEAYLNGMNLLCLSDQDFFPQVRFPESKQGFVQIRQSLEGFEKLFMQYYRKRHFSYRQTLYPPTFYAKISKE